MATKTFDKLIIVNNQEAIEKFKTLYDEEAMCECKDKENNELSEIRDYIVYRCNWYEDEFSCRRGDIFNYNNKTIDLLKQLIDNVDTIDYKLDE